jgi:predicted RNase H-like HicB family nuclease
MAEWLKGDGWKIVIHKCRAPETGYWGEVPAMPGCASQGETPEECRANVIDAARGCLECYLESALEKIAAPVRRHARRTAAAFA